MRRTARAPLRGSRRRKNGTIATAQVWFRITLEAVRRMQEETPGARGNRLGDPADTSPGTTQELPATVEVAAGDDGPGDAGHVGS